MIQGTHADGSPCPEGTQRLAPDGKICCDVFGQRTLACYFDIRYEYWPSLEGWFVIISPGAGGGGIAMQFCPHCGSKLAGDVESGRWRELD
jgi:hypothetical protein